MPTLAEKIRFAETYITNKEGAPWSLKGREWVRDEFWRAANGYKLWATDGDEVCPDCKLLVDSIIDTPADNPTRTEEHRATGCPGLAVFPILFVGLNLKRQDGKTFNSMAFALSEMAQGRNVSVALTAASEDQVKALFDENYREAIERSKKLAAYFRVVGLKIYCDKRRGLLEAMATSDRSATGRTRRYVLIDEAKDVPRGVADAVVHAIEAMSGVECPYGHVSRVDADAADAALETPITETCGACGSTLAPYFGRVIATSSSGFIDNADPEYQWFPQLVAAQTGQASESFEEALPPPSPYAHVFASDAPLNPAKSKTIQAGMRSFFGQLPAMRELTEAAMGSRWVTKGDTVLTRAELDAFLTDDLSNLDSCDLPCIAFLDWSKSVEKLSLAIVAEAAGSPSPWQNLFVARVDYWDPQAFGRGGINEDAYQQIKAHCLALLPRFPKLRGGLRVDTQGSEMAARLVKELRKHMTVEAWGNRGKQHEDESNQGWVLMEARIKTGSFHAPDSAMPGGVQQEPARSIGQLIRAEVRGVKKTMSKWGATFSDRNRKKMHKDITESLALLCYLASKLITERGKATMAGRSVLPAVRPRERAARAGVYRGAVVTKDRFNPNGY